MHLDISPLYKLVIGLPPINGYRPTKILGRKLPTYWKQPNDYNLWPVKFLTIMTIFLF